MKSYSRKLLKAGIVVFIAALFIGTSSAAIVQPSNTTFFKAKATSGINHSSRDQIEIKYYDTPSWDVGIQGGTPPYVWKSAIRLTQTELGPYNTWNITNVVVGFDEDANEGPVNVTIYIYNGSTATHPGSVIVKDTWTLLNGSDLFEIPLVTPVSLAHHSEIWVAVEWTQNVDVTHYAVMDEGPAVVGKGDWIYLNNRWQETHATMDYNWCIGAVVEGQGLATLGIANIKGPIGIKADVQNTGDVDANNVVWSAAVKGGALGRINITKTDTDSLLAAHQTLAISVPMFFGFGKISIVIKAHAANAQEVTAAKSAFVLGPFVIGIK